MATTEDDDWLDDDYSDGLLPGRPLPDVGRRRRQDLVLGLENAEELQNNEGSLISLLLVDTVYVG